VRCSISRPDGGAKAPGLKVEISTVKSLPVPDFHDFLHNPPADSHVLLVILQLQLCGRISEKSGRNLPDDDLRILTENNYEHQKQPIKRDDECEPIHHTGVHFDRTFGGHSHHSDLGSDAVACVEHG
jgi:hypothetical protein